MIEEHTRRSNLHYIFYAIAIAGGLWIGMYVGSKSQKQSSNAVTQDRYWKLNDVLDYVKDNYVDSIDPNTVIEEALSTILLHLDPHSGYIPLEEFKVINEQMSGNFEGIGIQFRIEKDTVLVIQTIPNGPSEKTGLLAGDRIIAVDGENIAGIGITNMEVMKKLKGKKGSKVQLNIHRRNVHDILKYTVARDIIPTYSIDYYGMVTTNIGFIKLSAFNLHSDREFSEALDVLIQKGMNSMIFDLRGNGGGSLDACISILDNFFESNQLLLYTEGVHRKRRNYNSSKRGKFKDGKIVVLVDEFSASASEIIAGAIQDHDRGTIIGRRTFGKGLVQEQIALLDGSAVRLTVARYYTPVGRSIQRTYANGLENYYEDFFMMMGSEEKQNIDNKEDTVMFKTKSGKIVYGGGGIKPDIIVQYPDLYTNKFARVFLTHIHQFAFEYTDNNRQILNDQYNSADEFIKNFYITDKIWQQYITFLKEKNIENITKADYDLQSSDRSHIHILIKAVIGRNLYDYACYYPIIFETDDIFKQAVKELNMRK